MEKLLLLFTFFLISFAKEENCEDLNGYWYNQHGSEMLLRHGKDGRLTGEYRTAVETKTGSAGESHSQIVGAAPYDKPGAAFAFSIIWRNGTSTTVWVAQCMVCDGQEKIFTSWLIRSQVDSCIDKWKSTLIGKDTFTRHEQREGPRKMNNTHVPVRPMGFKLARNTAGQRKPCSLKGRWYNEVGSEINFGDKDSLGTFTGKYRTAVEREKGSAGTSHSMVYGNSSPGDSPDSTFAMMVVWREGASVTGWVGQCHICGENEAEILEAAWLLKKQVQKCDDLWKSTLFYENSFTRLEQKMKISNLVEEL